jgi:endonuclease/exonuclease/phosphatase family metal-dependent hydrolase
MMKVLTLNIWGAPQAKHRSARIAAIAEKMKQLSPDVMCFQEVYTDANRKDLIGRLAGDWPHHHYFASSLLGSGLLTMSRYPITEAVFHRFRMGGKPERLKHGDYFVGKGIGLCRIALPDKTLDVYNMHPHAQYEMDNNNEYAVYNETSLFEATQFINAQTQANPLVFCGDFNTRPDQAGYRILMGLGRFLDAYKHRHGKHDITFSASNPYTDELDQILDYVMLRGLGIKQIELVCTERLVGEALAYSDHHGLLAELDFEQKPSIAALDTSPILKALHQRVIVALAETEGQQRDEWGKILLGAGFILDSGFITGIVGRFSKRLAGYLRTISWFTALAFATYHAIHAGVNLQARKRTLLALEQEIKKQLDALQK